jgi:hypothetical protein
MFQKQILQGAIALSLIAMPNSATQAKSTRFALPDGTVGLYITAPNASGDVAGTYVTPGDIITHAYGFVRLADGSFTTIDTKSYHHNTLVEAIDDSGDIVGQYEDKHDPLTSHAFIRAPDGTLTSFDAPGAYSTFPSDINARAAEMVGWYYTHAGNHGFIRTMDGTLSTIDDPDGAGGTYPYAVNAHGQITGTYLDSGKLRHGFVRQSDGSFATVDPPNSIYTDNVEINYRGQIGGLYQDGGTGIYYGFVLDRGTYYQSDESFGRLNARHQAVGQTFLLTFRQGQFSSKAIDTPKGCTNLFLSGINDSSLISGTMQCSKGEWFGYLR